MARANTVKEPTVQKIEKRQGPKTETVVAGAATAWLIVRPIAGKEKAFMEYARSVGFECYRPTVVTEKYNPFHRQVTVMTRSMFPGFVLVRPSPGQAYKVFSMPYVFNTLKLALFDKVIREIQSREKDGIIDALAPAKKPAKGDKVRVRTIAGMVDAVIAEPIDTNRIGIVTGLLKGSARVTCSLDQVVRH